MTRGGVFYNLYDSPYTVQLSSGHILYFSSNNHKMKYIEEYQAYVDYVNESLSRRFKFNIKIDTIGLIVFYSKVETRGFLVVKGGEYYTCLNNLKLNGGSLTSNA